MIENIKQYYKENPLTSIIFIGFILRFIAVIFSKGYGMHDDHYLIIEAAQSWVDGDDYNNWLPWNQNTPTVSGHSFFYVGIHYFILLFFKFIGITEPDTKMFLIRFIHAMYSLLIISLSYKITLKLSTKKVAIIVAWLLAVSWFMPFLSVRQLVEIVSIPPMLASIWIIIRDDKKTFYKYFIAGLIGALAFSIRFQTSLFIGGMGLALLFRKEWKEAFYFGLGVILSMTIIQGGIDLFIWGKPFTEFGEYVNYNLTHKNDYGSGAWYTYILVLAGVMIPPFGLLLFAGMFKTSKKLLIIFIPTLIFFAFHSYFPNKQERFIFPILPMFIILGSIGLSNLLDGYLNNKFWKAFYKYSLYFFIGINIILLPFTTTIYSKRARVESMLFLKNKESNKLFIYDATNENGGKMLPRFYLDRWDIHFNYIGTDKEYTKCNNFKGKYILFFGDDNLNNRIDSVENRVGEIKLEYKASPSLVDYILNKMNHHNANDTIFVYSKVNIK